MTPEARERLAELARATQETNYNDQMAAWDDFHEAASPDVVLALLERVARLEVAASAALAAADRAASGGMVEHDAIVRVRDWLRAALTGEAPDV